jgi:hypothetical protein
VGAGGGEKVAALGQGREQGALMGRWAWWAVGLV